jgi:hypothetical protein
MLLAFANVDVRDGLVGWLTLANSGEACVFKGTP